MIEFSKRNVNIKTLGERLRSIRERAGVSIEEIAKVTKVNKNYLEYIEADDYDNLPADVYVKGFLRNYSNFLGIEPRDVLKIYQKERGIQVNIQKPRVQDIKKKRIKIPAIVLPFRVMAGFLVGLFFIIIAWYFYVETGKFSEVPRLLISKPVNNAIIKKSSTEVIGVTDIGNKIIVNGQAIFVNEKGEFRERISLREGINNLVIKATNKFDKEIEKELNLSAQYKTEIPENSEDNNENANKEKSDSSKIKLYVKTIDLPVWIAVKIDGVKNYNGTMLAETEQVFEANSEIVITSGMANKTFIKLNNDAQYYTLADSAGVIRDVIFKKQDNDESDAEGDVESDELGVIKNSKDN